MGAHWQRSVRRVHEVWSRTPPLSIEAIGIARASFGVAFVIVMARLFPVLRDLYSDDGVAPSPIFSASDPWRWTAMFMGAPGCLYVVWSIGLVAAASLCVGWYSRASALVSFLAFSAIGERNLIVFEGADAIVRTVLFWSILMPTGAAYSIDATLRRRAGLAPPTFRLLPARLLQLALAWIYFASFVEKLSDSAWRNGTALHYALSLPHSETRAMFVGLANHPFVYVPGTYATLAFEALFGVLVWLPFAQPYARRAALISGILFHLGIATLMRVGNFSIVMLSLYPLWLDPAWARSVGERIFGDAAATRQPQGYEPKTWRKVVSLVAIALALAGLWTTMPAALERVLPVAPRPLALFTSTLWRQGQWRMFVPMTRYDGWLEARGQFGDGASVDVFREGLRGGSILPSPTENDRFRLYERTAAYDGEFVGSSLAAFICRRWNKDTLGRESRLERVDLFRYSIKVSLDAKQDAEALVTRVASVRCDSSSKARH